MSILVAMSENYMREFIVRAFREFGDFVEEVGDASEAFLFAQNDAFDCILIDRVLDSVCGISLLDFMRKNGVGTPVIVLSSSQDENDALLAFEAGADDYVRCPVVAAELVARVRAIRRRESVPTGDGWLNVHNVFMNRFTREVWRGNVKIQLQPRAYSILEILMENVGAVVTRTQLLETVWGYHFEPRTSVIETHVSRLRDRIDKPFDAPLIQTVRGRGYMIAEPFSVDDRQPGEAVC